MNVLPSGVVQPRVRIVAKSGLDVQVGLGAGIGGGDRRKLGRRRRRRCRGRRGLVPRTLVAHVVVGVQHC
jgi:hypothetical protein